MTLTNRMKVLDAGFSVFRQDPRSRIITKATPQGGWSRVGKFTTLAELRKKWVALMADPKAIDD
ncbi:MAG: hypothetical protein KAV00_03335 [Phycisphaerae bacterium]|nr:hypothetical protein [Phycisphaerae bacterium]